MTRRSLSSVVRIETYLIILIIKHTLSHTMFRFCLVLLMLRGGCVGYTDIKKYLKLCDRHSPDVNDCLSEAIEDAISTMTNGIEELEVPPLDPYFIDEVRIEYKNNQIQAKMIMTNIYVEGLKEAKVHDARLKADEDTFHLEVDLTTPRVFVRGEYLGEGGYNTLRINATGDFNSTMRDLVYTWKIDGKPEKRDNETYVRIKSFYMRPDVGDLFSYLTNNNPESRAITDFAINISNQNWRVLYREMLPYAQANWGKIGIDVANRIFLKIPFNQLFPVNPSIS